MTGPNPTDRGKLGTKRHVLTDGQGIPLSVVITAANTYDMKAAINTLGNIVIKRPSSKCLKRNRIFVLTKDMTFRRLRMMLSRKDTYHTFDIEENNLQQNAVIIILREEDGLLRELTPGTTGSENFWSDTKRS